MTLRIWSRLLQEALQKTAFFVQCYILSKSISSKNFKSLALADLKSVSLIFPKRYTYNYHESYHDSDYLNYPARNKASYNKFHESFCSVAFRPVETHPNQNLMTSQIV